MPLNLESLRLLFICSCNDDFDDYEYLNKKIKKMMPFAQDYVDENLAAFQAQITQLQGKCKSQLLCHFCWT